MVELRGIERGGLPSRHMVRGSGNTRDRLRGAGVFKNANGGATRDRTADLLHAMQALSQLSYSPTTAAKIKACGVQCQARPAK